MKELGINAPAQATMGNAKEKEKSKQALEWKMQFTRIIIVILKTNVL